MPQNDTDWSVKLAMFAFTSEGFPYYVVNRPWGYHILHSPSNLNSNQSNAKIGFEIDQAENVYINANINPYYLPFKLHVGTGIFGGIDSTGSSRNNTPNPMIRFTYAVTGSGTSLTGGTGTLKDIVCLFSSKGNSIVSGVSSSLAYLNTFYSSPDKLDDFQYIGSYFYNIWGRSNASGPDYRSDPYLFQYGKNVYTITCGRGGTSTLTKWPFLIHAIDPLSLNGTIVATGDSQFNGCNIQGSIVNTTGCYFAVRSQSRTGPGSQFVAADLYFYRFDLTTSLLTSLATFNLTGADGSGFPNATVFQKEDPNIL